MLLGKRPRHPIRRTTSMTGITVDLTNVEAPEPSDTQTPLIDHATTVGPEIFFDQTMSSDGFNDPRFTAMVSPRINNRNFSNDVMETPSFLRSCGLCHRRLSPGRDIYMYRGDTAFCSLECREKQMKQDERKEKCKEMASQKGDHRTSSSSSKRAAA